VYIGDVELGTLSDRELTRLRRDKLGFVFQAYNLVPTLDAAENITLPLALAHRKPDPDWFDLIVSTVGLGDRLDHLPSQLSGGQQQRVAVARALMSRPELVFADEPTGNLDSRSGAEVLSFLRAAVDDLGQTIVMVSHDPVAAAHADQVVFLADGRIADRMDQPTPERLLDRIKRLGGEAEERGLSAEPTRQAQGGVPPRNEAERNVAHNRRSPIRDRSTFGG
jgi:putative ABC transport system ATP-binding protein